MRKVYRIPAVPAWYWELSFLSLTFLAVITIAAEFLAGGGLR